MYEKKRINETKNFLKGWGTYLNEAGGLDGVNRSKIAQLLKRLGKSEQPPPIPDDAMPADGADDDNVVDDVDVIDSGNDLSMGQIMVVLNQLRNTGGLSFEDLGNDLLNQVRDSIKKTITTLAKRPGVRSSDIAQDKQNIEEVGGRILKRLEVAFEKLFQPRALVNLQEVLQVIESEEHKVLKEHKKLIIRIKD